MTDASDRFSAIFGNDQSPLEINTPDGAFNSSFNASWSASGINPAFLGFFPEMADDTYATIGLDGPAVSPQADPSLVEDSDQPITPFFTTNGATSLLSNHLNGSFLLRSKHSSKRIAGCELACSGSSGNDYWCNKRYA